MTPNLPNVSDVVTFGDRLIVVGPDSGMTAAAYRRIADATGDVPNNPLQPTSAPLGAPERGR